MISVITVVDLRQLLEYHIHDAAIDYAAMNTEFSKGSYSKINLRYQTKQNSEPRRLLTYAEQELILAEARVRGWITSGSAEAYYKNGVKAALISMMATDAAYAHGHAITTADIEGYSSELNYNSENLRNALDRQFDGYDEINKVMWLLKD